MDCSLAFDQTRSKNNLHGEGFRLYPHIHGTTSEAKNIPNVYGSLPKNADFFYPPLYNVHIQSNSMGIDSQSSLVRFCLSSVIKKTKKYNSIFYL